MKNIYTFENKWHQKYWSLILFIVFCLIPQILYPTIREESRADVFRISTLVVCIVSQILILKFTDYFEMNIEDAEEEEEVL